MRRLALALVAVTPFAAACTPALAAGVIVSPAPGTPDAAPQAQISILGVAPGRIRSVTVTGAASGRHTGRLRPYSGRRGASFLLRSPLQQGERAKVAIRIRDRAPVRYSFSVARFGARQPLLNIPVVQQSKVQHFVSLPNLVPPRITVLRGAASGSIFLTPLPSPIVHPGSNNTVTISPVGPGGPMILDRHGQLVWFRQLTPPDVAANLRIQRYRGRRVLTWWQGPVTPQAFGLGEGVIADSSYRTIATVHAGNGYAMDIHEFTLAPGGDALFTVYKPVLVHLPGTPAGQLSPLLDSIVQEVDVRTGLVVWEWHALGHIPLGESYATPANSASYDAFHINSIQPLAHGRLLISARDTSAIYELDRASGRIVWRLGGKASSFRLGRGARFWFQHDAQALPGDRISLFDDEAGPPQKAPSSRGLVLKLDMRHSTARVTREFHRPGTTSAQSEGSLQTLPGGNLFAGFGAQPFFSEFAPGGRLLFDASLPQDDGSYRAYTFRWSAKPHTRPDLAVRRAGPGSVSVYASWNGATGVTRWQVLAGGRAARLSPVASVARRSFETRIQVNGNRTRFAVRALGAHGRVLATSKTESAPAV